MIASLSGASQHAFPPPSIPSFLRQQLAPPSLALSHPNMHSGVAQWLACWAHNPKVRGSKPRSTMFFYRPRISSAKWARWGMVFSNKIWPGPRWGQDQERGRCSPSFAPAHANCFSGFLDGRPVWDLHSAKQHSKCRYALLPNAKHYRRRDDDKTIRIKTALPLHTGPR